MNKYLVFWIGDESDHESFNVYYSKLVMADSEDDAFDKYVMSGKTYADNTERENFGILEFTDKNTIA